MKNKFDFDWWANFAKFFSNDSEFCNMRSTFSLPSIHYFTGKNAYFTEEIKNFPRFTSPPTQRIESSVTLFAGQFAD